MPNRASLSDKSRGLALALGVPLGVFGAHRFYLGKIGTGVLQFVTLGGFGLWWLYDMLLLVGGGFRDHDGRRVLRWDFEATGFEDDGPHEALAGEVDALRTEVSELQERLDFAERLLAQTSEARGLGGAPRGG